MLFRSVHRQQWEGFAKCLADDLARKGEPHENMYGQLKRCGFVQQNVTDVFDINLNFENGGSQYMSCVKFTVKGHKDHITIVYAQWGKKWVEQSDYHLNRSFWESSPNDKKVIDFLKHGANKVLLEQLEAPATLENAVAPLEG